MEGTRNSGRARRRSIARSFFNAAFVSSTVLAGALMYGCQRGVGDNPLAPDAKESRESFVSHQLMVREAPKPIHLPKSSQGSQRLSVTDSVDAAKGGTIVLSSTFLDTARRPVSILIRLKFPPEALSQSTNITISLDSTDLITDITFGPHGTTFNHTVLLDVQISGFDFTGYDAGSVDVWYVDQGLWVESLQSQKILVNPTAGLLVAQDVELHHFSRYAFGR